MDEPIPLGDDSVTPSIEKRSSSIQTIDNTVRLAAVDNEELLADVSKEFLSGNPNRPLLHIDEDGSRYEYSLKPLRYSVMFILVIELLERFSYYGLNHSQLAYLTGEYNPEWNANLTTAQASSFVSSSVAIAYTAPFVGGVVADGILGDYWNIIFGTGFLYIPGLILIALCSYPYALGDTYNMSVLKAGMLALYPIGAGFIKSVVNIFGAKQYHPRLQSGLISSYYVNFYLAINIGSVLGGIAIPILAQENTAVAYTIPAIVLFLGLVIFILGNKRYVKAKPRKAALWSSLYIICSPLYCKSYDSHKKSNGGKTDDDFVTGIFHLLAVFPATMLIVPFMICYNQVSTVFVVQGEAMQKVGVFDASIMTNFDSISVIVSGLIVQRFFYPALERRGIRMKYSHKFALGTGLAALAVASSLIIDYRIHANINNGGGKINIFYQIFPYAFIGAGEIFTWATSYDVAFMIAPKEQKGLASGINLFVLGAISNFICIGIFNACSGWFPVNATVEEEYAASTVYNYLWVLIGVAIFGILFNALPPVTNWLERTIERSSKINSKERKSMDEASMEIHA